MKLLPFACTLALFTCTASAADIRLGLHVEGAGVPLPDFNGVLVIPGLEVSATSPLTSRMNGRLKLSAQYIGGLTSIRLDGTLLSRGDFYFGAGLGSGYAFGLPEVTAATPLGLANVHVVAGKNFGPAQVEAYLRAGLIYSAGLSVNYLLPNR